MKLTEEQIEKYKNNFHFEISENDLKKEWIFDKNVGFTNIINPINRRCINLKTNDGCWLKIDFKELTQEQIEELIISNYQDPIGDIKKEDIINAGIEYTMSTNPVCIGGTAFAGLMKQMNRNSAFEAGANWVLSKCNF